MRQLVTIILLLTSFEGFGQNDSQSGDKKNFDRIELGINISPDFTDLILRNNDGSWTADWIIDQRNERETPKLGLSAGLTTFWTYKICPMTGSCSWLCTTPMPEAMNGGESTRMPVQSPQPAECGTVTSLDNRDLKSGMSIGPNPFYDQTNIRFPWKCAECNLKIYNSTGQLISDRTVSGNQVTIQRGQLKSGFYIGLLNDNGRPIEKFKLLIQENKN